MVMRHFGAICAGLLALVCFWEGTPARASTPAVTPVIAPITLRQQTVVSNATPNIRYWIDQSKTVEIEDLVDARIAPEFAPILKSEPNFGFEPSPIWLRLDLANQESVALERVLVMRTNFVTEISVWHQQNSVLTQVLEQELASPFSSRVVDYHQLATTLQLEPNSLSTVWVRYRTTGLTAMPISVETNMSFATRSNREMARNFAFYGVMVVLIFASLLALVITRAPIFLWYMLYSGFVTLYIFHRDGYAFQLFWRDYGVWNSYASLLLAGLLTIFAAQFTRSYLDTSRAMRMLDKVLLTVIAVQAGTIAISLGFESEPLKQLMTVSIPISALIFLIAGVLGLVKKGLTALPFVLGWSGIVAASAVTFVAHWVDFEVTRAATLDTMRTAMVFDAIMMGIACFNVVMEWRRDREKLMQDRIEAAERNASLRNRLDLVEQSYAAARSAAESSSKLVAETTHDLRQPMFALRSSILKMGAQPRPDTSEMQQIEASLAYMESLVEQNLLQAMEGSTHAPSGQDDTTPAQRLLDTVSTIFAEDAKAAGITLNVSPSDAILHKGTADVLRVLSNLVSNAIAYSDATQIEVAATETVGGVEFRVLDNGKGMDTSLVDQISQRHARGAGARDERPEGKGLGLSIVADIAHKLGGEWRLDSAPGEGTKGVLIVP